MVYIYFQKETSGIIVDKGRQRSSPAPHKRFRFAPQVEELDAPKPQASRVSRWEVYLNSWQPKTSFSNYFTNKDCLGKYPPIIYWWDKQFFPKTMFLKRINVGHQIKNALEQLLWSNFLLGKISCSTLQTIFNCGKSYGKREYLNYQTNSDWNKKQKIGPLIKGILTNIFKMKIVKQSLSDLTV